MENATPGFEIAVLTELTPDQAARIGALAAAATGADGVAPLNEQVLLQLRYAGAAAIRHLVAVRPDGEWVGYGNLDLSDAAEGATAEVVVHPDARRHGVGTALVHRLLNEVSAAETTGPLRIWAHGHHPAAARLAAALGFSRVRDLWQMRRSLRDAVPAVDVPAGVTLRSFRPEYDEAAWLSVNARAFADHPEQGSMTAQDLAHRMAEPWFDPAGFLVAERAGELVGFHWTKVHAGGEHAPIGEVYVVGVDLGAQGLGLGRALTVAGLQYLRDRGLHEVMLYVEADNAPAIAVYQRLGFQQSGVDVMYAR